MGKENGPFISTKDYARRKIVRTLVTPVLRQERIVIEPEGHERARRLVEDEGYALCAVYSHPSQTDPARLLTVLIDIPFLKNRHILSPIAVHQNFARIPQGAAALAAIKVMPIVTEESLKKQAEKNEKRVSQGKKPKNRWERNAGLGKFTQEMVEDMRNGRVVLLSTQGTRQPRLEIPESPTMGHLFLQLRRRHVEKVAFWFMGVGIPGTTDYQTVRGYNFLSKRYDFYTGSTLTMQEILDRAGGKIDQIDRVMTEELDKYVPFSYKMRRPDTTQESQHIPPK
jgi:hypothetical protein